MSKKRKKPTKPTGVTGPIKVTVDSLGTTTEFLQVPFPTSKEDIEALVVRGFVVTASKNGHFSTTVEDVRQNPMDDWDFSFKTDVAEGWLELMEIAPLHSARGSYDRAPASYNTYDFAKYVHGKLVGKSNHYVKPSSRQLWLLMYVTAWQFIPSETAVALLQYWTCTTAHVFDRIYLYKPLSEDDGILWHIYPTPSEFWTNQRFDPERYRDSVVHNIDPRTVRPDS